MFMITEECMMKWKAVGKVWFGKGEEQGVNNLERRSKI